MQTNSRSIVIRKLKCNEPFARRKDIQKSLSPPSLQFTNPTITQTGMWFLLQNFYFPPKNYHLLMKPIAPSHQP